MRHFVVCTPVGEIARSGFCPDSDLAHQVSEPGYAVHDVSDYVSETGEQPSHGRHIYCPRRKRIVEKEISIEKTRTDRVAALEESCRRDLHAALLAAPEFEAFRSQARAKLEALKADIAKARTPAEVAAVRWYIDNSDESDIGSATTEPRAP